MPPYGVVPERLFFNAMKAGMRRAGIETHCGQKAWPSRFEAQFGNHVAGAKYAAARHYGNPWYKNPETTKLYLRH